MVIFFYSTQDPASAHAGAAVKALRSHERRPLRGFEAWHFDGPENPVPFDLVELPVRNVTFQDADLFGTDLAVFLSRHAAAGGKPCFTCHLTGNFGEPKGELGGAARTLSTASAHWLKRFYLALKEKTGRVSMEATHHGPTLKTPTLFVETGSDESEWVKPENGRLMAESVLAALECPTPAFKNDKVALGFGGTHYCSAFTPLLEQGWAFSHVASKHSVEFVSKDLLQQAVQKTVEPVEMVFLDKGGLPSAKRKEIEGWCGELGLACESI